MRIFAIDPAQRTGWAFGTVDHRVDASGVWQLGPDADLRVSSIAKLIRRADAEYMIECLAYEAATYGSRNPNTQRRHNELAGVIRATCTQLGITCWAFGIGTWKARAVGNGSPKTKMPAVIRGLRTFYGIDCPDRDQAAAIGILLAAMRGPPPEPKKQTVRRMLKARMREPRLF